MLVGSRLIDSKSKAVASSIRFTCDPPSTGNTAAVDYHSDFKCAKLIDLRIVGKVQCYSGQLVHLLSPLDPCFLDDLLVVRIVMEQLANGQVGLLVLDILQNIILIYPDLVVRSQDYRSRLLKNWTFLGMGVFPRI